MCAQRLAQPNKSAQNVFCAKGNESLILMGVYVYTCMPEKDRVYKNTHAHMYMYKKTDLGVHPCVCSCIEKKWAFLVDGALHEYMSWFGGLIVTTYAKLDILPHELCVHVDSGDGVLLVRRSCNFQTCGGNIFFPVNL